MTILTPAQSQAARLALGLSQSKVARATGINRSTLSMFESSKYLLEDRALRELRNFYQGQGYPFEEKAAEISLPAAPTAPKAAIPPVFLEPDRAPVMDGFVIPTGIALEEVENALDEVHANDQAIAEIVAQPVKRNWFTDEFPAEATDKAVKLMARNYLLIRQLQGHTVVEAANDDGEPRIQADLLHRKLND
ncbi:MAG: helix-turn-helix domain-containing protein [Gammaproteobacteria bacterium]